MVEVQNRDVINVPGPGEQEVEWDTTLDPEQYDSNVTVAATLASLINKGKAYDSRRAGIVTILPELEEILLDLKYDNGQLTDSSRLALFNYAIDRVSDIGRCVDFKWEGKK